MKFFRFLCFLIEAILVVVAVFLSDLTTKIPNEKIVEIPEGSASKILSELSKKYPYFTKFDARILASFGHAKAGSFELSGTNLAKIDFLYELTKAKPLMQSFTLIPGETTIVFLKNLAKDHNFDFEKLQSEYSAVAPFYEGFLVPETYKISKDENEAGIIKHLVNSSLKFHENLSKEILGDFNITAWQSVIIKASVIQKEAANAGEMPIVASVIENRLAKNMKLQMDGTLNYGEYSHIRVTPERIRTDTSEFNTYLHDGLPKSAVCTVSKDAIKAALNPATTDYLYFMLDRKKGAHDFAKTIAEHQRNVAKARK